MLVLQFKLLNSILMVNTSLSGNGHHFLSDRLFELLHIKDLHQLIASYDEQIGFCVDKSCTITPFILKITQDITVTKVATLNVHIEGSVKWHIDKGFKYIIHKLDFALQDEIDFICVVILVEKVLSTKEVHLLKLWHEFPKKLRWLIRKELDIVSDVLEDLFGYLAFECHWELIQDFTNCLRNYLFIKTVVLNVHLDVFLELVRDAISVREF